jgi:hypothetical protein
MTTHSQFDMTGIKRMEAALLDTNGFPEGLSGSLSNGADEGFYRVEGIQNPDLSMGSPELVTILGDGRFQSAYVFPPGAAPQGNIDGAIYDMDFAVAIDKSKKVTKGHWAMHVLGGREAEYLDVAGIFTGWGKSKTTGYRGKTLYWGYMVPKMQIALLGTSPMQQRNAVQVRMFVAVSEADMYPWGEAFTVANEGVTGGVMIPWSGVYPITMHTFVGDGTTATVVLDETPAGDDTATPQCVFVYNATGAEELTTTTDYTVVVATKTLTFQAGAIPAAGEVHVIYYAYVP